MTCFIPSRFDLAASAIAIICLMGPLLMGIAATLGAGV